MTRRQWYSAISSNLYNFDSDYYAKEYKTYNEALKALREFLQDEIKLVKEEPGYEPSVLDWDENDVTLVYAEGYPMQWW